MAIVSNLELIRRVPLFSDLTPGQSGIISSAVGKRRFRRGETIVEQGAVSGMLFMILSGKARVVAQDDRGREVIMASLGPGDCIGEMSLIDGDPHSATVRAEVQTDVLTLEHDAFTRCLRDNVNMAEAVMRVWTGGRCPARHGRRRSRWHPGAAQEGVAAGSRPHGRRLARDGEPGHEAFRGQRPCAGTGGWQFPAQAHATYPGVNPVDCSRASFPLCPCFASVPPVALPESSC